MKKIVCTIVMSAAVLSAGSWGVFAQKQDDDIWFKNEMAEEADGARARADIFPAGRNNPPAANGGKPDAPPPPAAKETAAQKAAAQKAGAKKPGGFGEGVKDFFTKEGETRHLDPYTKFALAIMPTWYCIGLSTDFPLSVPEMLSDKDIPGKKENGRLIFDLKSIYKNPSISSNGLDINFEFAVKNTLAAEMTMFDAGLGVSIGSIFSRFDVNLNEGILKMLADGIEQGTHNYAVSVSGAVFAETLKTNWHKKDFVLNGLFFSVSAAHYIPYIYIPHSKIGVTLENTNRTALYLEGGVKAYMASDLVHENYMPETLGGLDLSLQAEYAVFSILDIGVTALNIPFVPSTLKYAASRQFTKENTPPFIEIDSIIDTASNGGNFELNTKAIDSVTSLSGYNIRKEENTVVRPMRWDFYALFRPIRSDILVLRPSIGFTLLTPAEENYFNAGFETQINIGRVFGAAWYTGLCDGIFRNRLSFDWHLWKISRLFLALEMRSQDPAGAWTMKGAAVEIGYKWGGGFRGVTNF